MQEDRDNFFKNYASIVSINAENNVFGYKLGTEIQCLAHAFYLQKDPFVILLGGEITFDKLLALDSIVEFADVICLLGKIGLFFFMFTHGYDEFGGYKLDK